MYIFRLSLQRRLRLALLAIFIISFSVLIMPESTLAEDAWRTRSRQAVICLEKGELAQASNGYLAALEILPKDREHQNVRCDLLLALSETYRRRKDFGACERTLTKVKSDLDSHKCSDPLLPARYWRRRRDFLEALGQEDASALASIEVIKIVEHHFGTTSENFINAFRDLMDRLIRRKNWQQLLDYMKGFVARMPSSDAQEDIAKNYQLALSHIRFEIYRLIQAKKFAKAKSLLIELQEVELNKENLPDIWQVWLTLCLEQKQTHRLEQVNEKLLELSRTLEKSSSPASVRAAAKCHYLLARLSSSRFQPSQEASEWRAVEKTVKKLGNSASSLDRLYLAEAIYKEISETDLKDPKNPEILEKSSHLVELTQLPPRGKLEQPMTKRFESLHCRSRFRLTSMLVRRDELEEAEMVLASINESTVRTVPNGPLRMTQLHILLATAWLDKKVVEQARKHCKRAELYESLLEQKHDSFSSTMKQKLTQLKQDLSEGKHTHNNGQKGK